MIGLRDMRYNMQRGKGKKPIIIIENVDEEEFVESDEEDIYKDEVILRMMRAMIRFMINSSFTIHRLVVYIFFCILDVLNNACYYCDLLVLSI